MSFVVLLAHHASPPALATAFALMLVATLVVLEEQDVKRDR